MKTYLLAAGAAVALAALALARPAHPPVAAFRSVAPEPAAHRRIAARPSPGAAVVYVAGAVASPGLYRLAPGARAADAVRAAGGLRPDADPVAVNLAARVADGDEIAVPRAGQATPRASRRARVRPTSPPPDSVALNAAGAEALARVPGLGPSLATRIVAFRDANGPFASLDELLDVNGMTPARLDRAAPFLQVP